MKEESIKAEVRTSPAHYASVQDIGSPKKLSRNSRVPLKVLILIWRDTEE